MAAEVLGRIRESFPGVSGPVRVTWRDWRWLIEPENADVIAFLSPDEPGWHRLRREAALLVRLAPTGVPAPGLISESRTLRLQLRARISGLVGHEIEHLCFGTRSLPGAAARYHPDCPLTARGRRLATELGSAIARLHQTVPVMEARGLGFENREQEDWERISTVLGTHAPDLLAALVTVRRWESGLPDRRVFAHGDVHMFNIGAATLTGALTGLFDFDTASLAHPYEDLKFAFSNGYRFAEQMLDAYGEEAGTEVSLTLLKRFHVRAALAHFEHVPPGSDRFRQVVEWSRAAARAFAPEWSQLADT